MWIDEEKSSRKWDGVQKRKYDIGWLALKKRGCKKRTMHREREAVPVFIENVWKPEPKEFEEILNNELKLRRTSGNGREASHRFELK